MPNTPPPPESIDRALARLGYAAFRPGQREAVALLLERGRVLLVAPTGGGKSLCYQLPALVLGGTTLVISPLIALMQDQVTALAARGIAATYLASTLDPAQLRERLTQLGRGAFRLVYVAPERLSSSDFRQRLIDLDCPLVAIDEAHCISEWGHDFRRDYLQLGALVRELTPRHVLACTATATPVVRDEIVARLGLPPDTPQLVRGFARPNLALRAIEVTGARQRGLEVDAALGEALVAPGRARGAAILYTPTRRLAEETGARLAGSGWQAVVYHAGLEPETRAAAQEAFTSGAAELVCATNAFGMGIDRADVRAVIHLGPPGSVEAYYQEVGRAGRDGHDALGLLCWSQQDLPLRRRLLERPTDGAVPDSEIIAHKWNLFLELIRWAEGGSCRHDAILRYFGDEAETLAGCGRCDVCTALDTPASTTDEDPQLARILLSGVARLDRRFGLKQVVRLLHGDAEERLARLELTRVPTFGRLRDRPPEWIQRALSRCVTAGWVAFSGEERPLVHLTRDGIAVMRGEQPARWLPPPLLGPQPPARRPRAPSAAPRGSVPAAATEDAALDPAALPLFEALRTTRRALAQQLGVPAYVVAHDRTLRELARQRPRSSAALRQVPGFGPQKTERFGPTFLEVIAEHSPS